MAQQAAETVNSETKQEQEELESLSGVINNTLGITIDANKPELGDGMIPVYYNSSTGNWVICSEDDENWYDYDSKQWANVMLSDGRYTTSDAVGTEVTKDELGSMFVWIPRYAYKIEGYKTSSGTIDIVWLSGTTNEYIDDSGVNRIASTSVTLDSSGTSYTDYVVHPCFTNGNGNYDNGEWDSEISGFWVSKFEGGSAMSTSDELNGSLGTYDAVATVSLSNGNGTTATYYYPMFKGQRYSYNYLTMSYMYNMMLALNDSGNIYGLSTSTDSHLIKNSEWGAVAYLSYSKYGIGNGDGSSKNYINNVNYEGTVSSSYVQSGTTKTVYAVTGYAGATVSAGTNTLSASIALGDTVTNSITSYAWYTTEGQLNSTTGNIYGIYDMSGGQWDNTAAYVSYGSYASYLTTYGAAFANGTDANATSTKYVTAYKADTTVSNYSVNESYYLWTLTNGYYGDGIYEISTRTTLTSSGTGGFWNAYQEADTTSQEPFFLRGGNYYHSSNAGLFYLADNNGISHYNYSGFRAVLVVE